MVIFASFVLIYSYCIFTLGIFSLLYKPYVISLTILFIVLLIFFFRNSLIQSFTKIKEIKIVGYRNKLDSLLVILFVILAAVNLIGALGPELAFDALWYHLTLPKLYLLHHSIFHIPGGLLYYSDMPKLGETLYIGALSIGNEIAAKVIHYFFGVISAVALYKVSRKFFSIFVSLVVILIFYSNLVVDSESISAYIDLIRTFFEITALWSLLNWVENKKISSFILSALFLGGAITTKVLAIGDLFVYLPLITVIFLSSSFKMSLKLFSYTFKNKLISLLISLALFSFIAFLIPSPWLVTSFIHTGNPFYPFFTSIYPIHPTQFGIIQFFVGLWNIFMYSSDPISPLYLIFFPLLVITFIKLQKEIKLIVLYCVLSLILWYFTPQTGGGRFLLPYLPAFSMVCGAMYAYFDKKTTKNAKFLSKMLFFTIIFVILISIGYRFLANYKYMPVLLHRQTTSQFLIQHLNFSFGDFYDTDNYFKKTIKPTDRVLLYGFHNLYYVDFPFVDSSWIKKGYKFNYIATQKTKLPSKYANWHLIYNNDKTMVQLYQPPKEECRGLCSY
ncbi:MAG TPA: hypothetical protein VLF93_06365 [Candidatus Saccharimonadales bacterium]|nr:hypothetical protein [Candidatus Saccharimonadales bacterium]